MSRVPSTRLLNMSHVPTPMAPLDGQKQRLTTVREVITREKKKLKSVVCPVG